MMVEIVLIGSEENTYMDMEATVPEVEFLKKMTDLANKEAPGYGVTMRFRVTQEEGWHPPESEWR